MSTNYYWIEKRHEEEDHINQHIGKISGAGYYCYECGTTLNRGGNTVVHNSSDPWSEWLENCPSCGKQKDKTCWSMTWTLMKHKREIEQLAFDNPVKKVIVDEYGIEYSALEFLKELNYCPIEFQSPREFF